MRAVCQHVLVIIVLLSMLKMANSYKLYTSIASNYAPIIIRSFMLHEQTKKSKFPTLKESGATNIDL